jgi:hypothetical protein
MMASEEKYNKLKLKLLTTRSLNLLKPDLDRGLNMHCKWSLNSTPMRRSVFLFGAALWAGAHASNVVELVPNNFDKLIGKGTPALVEL